MIADVAARHATSSRQSTRLITGTDEHGLKIQLAAAKEHQNPLEFCDRISARFKSLFERSDVAFDRYLRTTDPAHMGTVQLVWVSINHFDQLIIYRTDS